MLNANTLYYIESLTVPQITQYGKTSLNSSNIFTSFPFVNNLESSISSYFKSSTLSSIFGTESNFESYSISSPGSESANSNTNTKPIIASSFAGTIPLARGSNTNTKSIASSFVTIPLARGSAGKQLLQRQLTQASNYLQQAMHGAVGLKQQIENLGAAVTSLNDYTSKTKEQIRLAYTNPAIHTDIVRQSDYRCTQEEEERLAELVENASNKYTAY